MKKSAVIFALIVWTLLSITGCNENPESGSGLSGNLGGSAGLIDLNENQILNSSGITVSAEGTGFTTTSDSSGTWNITSLPQGTYNIVFSKSGFGTLILPDFQFVGGGQASAGQVYLYQIPTYSVKKLSDSISFDEFGDADYDITFNVSFSGSIPTDSGYTNAYVFFGTNSSVSSDSNNYLYYTEIGGNAGDTSISQKEGYDLPEILIPGKKIYTIAYGGSYSPIEYTNPITRKSSFSGLDPTPSNIDSFVVP